MFSFLLLVCLLFAHANLGFVSDKSHGKLARVVGHEQNITGRVKDWFDDAEEWAGLEHQEVTLKTLIVPGTKWCGAGNVANGPSDLGSFSGVDECCRQHDQCQDWIDPFSTKHGLRNKGAKTKMLCGCDKKFRFCLRSVNSKAARVVGHLYFNVIGDDCFRKDFPVIACALSVPDHYVPLKRQRCLLYAKNREGDKRYQFFNVPFY